MINTSQVLACNGINTKSPHHTVDELKTWFTDAGFGDVTVLPPEKTGGFYRWTYERNLLIGSGVNVTGIRQG